MVFAGRRLTLLVTPLLVIVILEVLAFSGENQLPTLVVVEVVRLYSARIQGQLVAKTDTLRGTAHLGVLGGLDVAEVIEEHGRIGPSNDEWTHQQGSTRHEPRQQTHLGQNSDESLAQPSTLLVCVSPI